VLGISEIFLFLTEISLLIYFMIWNHWARIIDICFQYLNSILRCFNRWPSIHTRTILWTPSNKFSDVLCISIIFNSWLFLPTRWSSRRLPSLSLWLLHNWSLRLRLIDWSLWLRLVYRSLWLINWWLTSSWVTVINESKIKIRHWRRICLSWRWISRSSHIF